MTSRQAATIIGLLIVVVLGIAIFGGSEDSQGQTPGQILGESSVITMPSGVVAGVHPSLGAYAFTTKGDGVLVEGAPPDPETVAAMNAVLGVKLPPLVPAAGKETAGSMIDVAGKAIQLPAHVYVEAMIVAGLCPVGTKCLEPPVYALYDTMSGVTTAVSSKSGKIGDPSLSAEELTRQKAAFQWLVDAVEGKAE